MIKRYQFKVENAYIVIYFGKFAIADSKGFLFAEDEIPNVTLALYDKRKWHSEAEYNYFMKNNFKVEKLTFGGKQW